MNGETWLINDVNNLKEQYNDCRGEAYPLQESI